MFWYFLNIRVYIAEPHTSISNEWVVTTLWIIDLKRHLLVELLFGSCSSSSSLCKGTYGFSQFHYCSLKSFLSVQTQHCKHHTSVTSDDQCHGGLGRPQFVLDEHFVSPVVSGSHRQYEQGADSTHVGDVVVGVGVQADVVVVPRHSWSWISPNRAAHVALVTLRSGTRFQGNDEWRRWLQVEGFSLWRVHFELSWNATKRNG